MRMQKIKPIIKGQAAVLDHKKTSKQARKYRESQGVTATDVADALDVDRSYICKLESGVKKFTEASFDKYISAVDKIAGSRKKLAKAA